MSAELRLYQKKIFKNGSILETILWEINKSNKYPDGIKYRLIFINIKTNEKVLLDNHTPKGHHYHLDDEEYNYNYQGMDQLIEDFKLLVKNHMGVEL